MTTPTTPGAPDIMKSKKLTIYPTENVKKYSWSQAFKDAYEQFNKLSLKQKLVVMFQLGDAPDPKDWRKGANVQFHAFDVPTKRTVAGKTVTFYPDGLDGFTDDDSVFQQYGENQPQIKVRIHAFINVPATPKVAAIHNGAKRDVGDKVKLFIALHEMIHACGFTGHSKVGIAGNVMVEVYHAVATGMTKNDDVVVAPPRFDPGFPINTSLDLPSEVADLIRNIWK
jgi:hypothetical protein